MMQHQTVLLVENDDDAVEPAVVALGEDATRVAHDAEEAAHLLFGGSGYRPNLILMSAASDMIALLQRIKRDWRTSTIPVILLVGSERERDELRDELGAAGFLVKPMDAQRLAEAAAPFSLYWRRRCAALALEVSARSEGPVR